MPKFAKDAKGRARHSTGAAVQPDDRVFLHDLSHVRLQRVGKRWSVVTLMCGHPITPLMKTALGWSKDNDTDLLTLDVAQRQAKVADACFGRNDGKERRRRASISDSSTPVLNV